MKIVHLIRALSSGGGERMVAELSNRMATLGHDVTVCMMEDPEKNPDRAMMRHWLHSDVRFVSLDIPGRWTPAQMKRASRLLREMKADILHFHMCGIWYLLPLLLRPEPSDPVIVETIHTMPSHALSRGRERHVMKRLYRSRRVHPVVLSQTCAEEFDRLYAPARSTVIPNGRSAVVPTEEFGLVEKEVSHLCGDSSAPVFIHIGRFHEAKNQKCLVETFNRLHAAGQQFTLLVIGRGYDAPQAASLRAVACRAIRFLGEKKNPGDYLLLSDYLCLTSIYEGVPVTVIEALSCGVTPICTPVGGIPSMISDGITGYLSTSCDVEDYTQTIRRGIGQPIRPSVLRRLYASEYTIEVCTDRYLKYYASIIDSGRSGSRTSFESV